MLDNPFEQLRIDAYSESIAKKRVAGIAGNREGALPPNPLAMSLEAGTRREERRDIFFRVAFDPKGQENLISFILRGR
jgi:hypothetical protein